MSSAENDTHTGRLVWIDGLLVNLLLARLRSLATTAANEMADRLEANWDAAPADPTEALIKATGCLDGMDCTSCREYVHELLAALGVPRDTPNRRMDYDEARHDAGLL